jgi:phosphatidylserine synthase
MKSLFLGIFLFIVGQIAVWFQTNGQFISPWMKNNPIMMAFIGVPISFAYIFATTYIVEYYEGDLWPSRLIGFAAGIVSFSFLTYIYMGEGLSLKTLITLILAIIIVLIQVFYK